MRIMVLSPFPVGPSSLGGMLRLFRWTKHLLLNGHKVDLVYFIRPDESMAIDDEELRSLGCKVYSIKMKKRHLLEKIYDRLQIMPIAVTFYNKQYARDVIDKILNESDFDLIHLEFGYLSPYIKSISKRNLRTILVEEDLFFMSKGGLSEHSSWLRKVVDNLEIKKLRNYQKSILDWFDKIYTVSHEEKEWLMPYSSQEKLSVFPNTVNVSDFISEDISNESKTVLFLGNYGHHTNVEGVKWFIDNVWTTIVSEVPNVKLVLAGANPNKYINSLSAHSNISVTGYIDNIGDVFNYSSVFIVPIISSSGMRGKVLEAMASKKAIVSTSRGLAGIEATDGIDLLIADDPKMFADCTIDLLKNRDKRIKLSSNSHRLVKSTYDDSTVFPKMEKEYEALSKS